MVDLFKKLDLLFMSITSVKLEKLTTNYRWELIVVPTYL